MKRAPAPDASPWGLASAAAGAVTWGALWMVPFGSPGPFGLAERLLLFHILVLTPLGLRLAACPDAQGRHPLPYRLARWAHAPAAGLAVFSYCLPRGLPAALCAGGWLVFTALAALFGLFRFWPRRFARAEELVIDVGLAYFPVGAGWLVLSRYGAHPVGFGDAIVFLTAVHFHFAGFAACLLTGLTGRKLLELLPSARRWFPAVVANVVLGTPILAAGITLNPVLEFAGAAVLASGLVMLAGIVLLFVAPRVSSWTVQTLLALSALSVLAPMLLAVAYALAGLTGRPRSIPDMIYFHGVLNAFGFALLGLLAWTIENPQPAR